MAEFIDRIAFINKLEKIGGCATICTKECKEFIDCEINVIKGMLRSIPAADVAPVVHGHWVYGCQCSVCGDRHGPYNARHIPYYNYCPNCGAKMDEEANDGR